MANFDLYQKIDINGTSSNAIAFRMKNMHLQFILQLSGVEVLSKKGLQLFNVSHCVTAMKWD